MTDRDGIGERRRLAWSYLFWVAIMALAVIVAVAALASTAVLVPLLLIGFPLTIATIAGFLLIVYVRDRRG